MNLHFRSMLAGLSISMVSVATAWWILTTTRPQQVADSSFEGVLESRLTRLEKQLESVQANLGRGLDVGAGAGGSAALEIIRQVEAPRVEATRVSDEILDGVDPKIIELMKMQWMAACDDKSGLRDILLRLGKCPTDKGVFRIYLHSRNEMDDFVKSWCAGSEKLRLDVQEARDREGVQSDPESLRAFSRAHPEFSRRNNESQQAMTETRKRIQDDMETALKALD
jgi:hypothetical protein